MYTSAIDIIPKYIAHFRTHLLSRGKIIVNNAENEKIDIFFKDYVE